MPKHRDLLARLAHEARLLRNLEKWNSYNPLPLTESWRDPLNDQAPPVQLEQVSEVVPPVESGRGSETPTAPVGAEDDMSAKIDSNSIENSQNAAEPASGAESAQTAGVARPSRSNSGAGVQKCAEVCTNEQSAPDEHCVEHSEFADATAARLGLTSRQRTAINLIVMGRSLGAVAQSLGIHRNTIFKWRTQNPLFAAELARRQREIFDTATNRLRLTLIKSLNVVDRWLDNGEYGPKTALRLLAQLNLKSVVAPQDPMDEQQIADDLIRHRRRLAGEDDSAEITPADRLKLLEEVKKQEKDLGL